MTQQQGATHRASGHYVPKSPGLGRLPNKSFLRAYSAKKSNHATCVAMVALLAVF